MQTQTLLNTPLRWLNWLEKKAGSVLSFEKVVFILMVLLHLLPVWTEKYILNTDGPAHTYTSKVLLDYFFGRNLPLYRQYFALDYYADPNWFSRFWLMFLQVFFNGRIAEKLLVSAYLILFPVLFRKLLIKVNPANGVFSLLIFPFLSHHVFNYGFYNYSFAVAFLFGFLWFWKKNEADLNPKNWFIGMLLCTGMYFTHLWGFIFIGFFTAVLIFSEAVFQLRSGKLRDVLKDTAIKSLKFFCMMLPGIVLAIIFIKAFLLSEDLYTDESQKLVDGFFKLDALRIYSHKEHFPSHLFADVLLFLFAVSLLMKLPRLKWSANDGFLLCAIIATVIYFEQPAKLTVGASWIFRMVLLPYLFLIIWSASVDHFKLVKLFFGAAAVFISIYFVAIRWPYYHRVSQAMEEYLSVSGKIPLRSTVLPISFNHKGNMPDGGEVCPEFYKFIHAFDYGCMDRDAISFAHNDWIPLRWTKDRNPFTKLGNMELQPPCMGIPPYAERSNGGQVEYVVTWCMDKNYWWTPEWQDIQCQIEENYTLIDSSPHNLAKLYKIN